MKYVPDLAVCQDPIAIFAGTFSPEHQRRVPGQLFSAVLGYFLDPHLDHGFGCTGLAALLKGANLPPRLLAEENLLQARVRIEKNLG